MRLRLPFSLRKSVLSSLVSMVALSLGSGSAWAVTESESQNLVFDGATLTWNTDTANKVFTNAAGESASFAPGDNVIFARDASVSLGEDIFAGQINIASGADVVIELADNGLNFDTLSMLGGSLDAGDSLNIAAGETLAVGSNGSVLKSDLVLEKNASLSVDYSGTGAATSLNDSVLVLQGGTRLQLSGCGNGDGKTYTLLTGVSELKDALGGAIILTSDNNAITNYFDISQPGTGFWSGSTLILTDDGVLQLVLHEKDVQEAVTLTKRQTSVTDYQYYEEVSFINITADDQGGAIYGGDDSTITLSNNGRVKFIGNLSQPSDVSAKGAAIAGNASSTILLSNNGSVEFKGNKAVCSNYYQIAYGGAISGDNIILCDNGSVYFTDNATISPYHGDGGGAINGRTISLQNNSEVSFVGNSSTGWPANGGALYGWTIELNNNGNMLFSGNEVSGRYVKGGAINSSLLIALSNNTRVEFKDNIAIANEDSAEGGAIFTYGNMVLSDNETIIFKGNKVVSCTSYFPAAAGAAIFSKGNLSVQNNSFVLFEKNSENVNGVYRLRSIYSGGNGKKVSFSAAESSNIEFRDSVYIDYGSTVSLNADYTDKVGIAHKQQGDIIFTGAYAEEHLNELLISAGEKRKATTEEILTSRTTEVNAMTNLYGGRLRVEDGAIYKGLGITAHEGSEATVRVKDAMLNHTGYELHFFEGTKLEALGASEIFGDVIVESTATAAFSAFTRLEGCLTLLSGSELSMDGALTLNGALNLGTSLTLSGDILGLVKQLQAGQSLTLMVGLDSLTVQSSEQLRSVAYTEVESGQSLLASDYFSNLDADSEFLLLYDGAVGSLSISSGKMIPEPATTTLGLLALTALMARRRRK